MLSEDFVAPQIKSTLLINSGASCRREALPLFSSFLLTSLLFACKKHRIKGSFTHARAAKRENRAKVTLVWIWWSERSSRRARRRASQLGGLTYLKYDKITLQRDGDELKAPVVSVLPCSEELFCFHAGLKPEQASYEWKVSQWRPSRPVTLK